MPGGLGARQMAILEMMRDRDESVTKLEALKRYGRYRTDMIKDSRLRLEGR